MTQHKTNLGFVGFAFFIGFITALYFQWLYAFKFGEDWTRLLHVTTESPLYGQIAAELSPLSVSPDAHDGVIFYTIARHPLGLHEINWGTNVAFRYRRILYPLLSGGFGMFSARHTLWGLIIFAALGTALAASALAYTCERYGFSPLTLLGVFAHPGVWTANVILASDNLALGLGLWGIVLIYESRLSWAIVSFGLAALTKEVYWLFALSSAVYLFKKRDLKGALLTAIVSALPVGLWALYIEFTFPSGGALGAWGNVTLPFRGLAVAATRWSQVSLQDSIYSIITCLLLVGCLFYALRSRVPYMRLLIAPWVILAAVLSEWIWTRGNDSIRDLLPLGVFLTLAIALQRNSEPNCRKCFGAE